MALISNLYSSDCLPLEQLQQKISHIYSYGDKIDNKLELVKFLVQNTCVQGWITMASLINKRN
jgi:hypothetical protein